MKKEITVEKYIDAIKQTITIKGVLELENERTRIEVIGKNIKHKHPYMSYIRDNTLLYVDGLIYKRKNVGGIRDVPQELIDWYWDAKREIEKKKEKDLQEEIEKSKREKITKFQVVSGADIYFYNKYINSLLTETYDRSDIHRIIEILNIEPYDIDRGDYSIYEYYKAETDRLAEAILKVNKEAHRKKIQGRLKYLQERKKDLQKTLNNGGRFKNMYVVNVDAVTGHYLYTFSKRVPRDEWRKVAHLFEYINTDNPSDAFDPLYDGKFKGYATRTPDKVCDILYPNWEEEIRKEVAAELEQVEKDIERIKKEL